ncbi:MAG TPA: PAS domain S-box protein [Ignavibacteriaceae bacterium]|nr:PAS domain S-box protein [Ignavibacteriaceae bacterium]
MDTFENIKVLIQIILDGIDEAFIIIEESGQILLMNKSAKNIFSFDESIKFFQDYVQPDCWQELNIILKSKSETESEINLDAFTLKLKGGEFLSVNFIMKEITFDNKKIFLIIIVPNEVNIPSTSLKSISILPADIQQIISDENVQKIITDFTSYYPLTFIQKELIEKQIDALNESFWIKDSDGNILVVNNKLCDILGLKKFQLEGKNYKQFIPEYLNFFFDVVEKYQSDLKNPIAINGISMFNFALSKGKEIVEIPVIDNDRKIIALVGFSRDIPSTLPINRSRVNEEIVGDIFSFMPVPIAVIENYAKIKLCNQEFCKLVKKNSEDILNSDLKGLFPSRLSEEISNFVKNDSDGIIIDLNESLEVIPEPGNGYHLQISRYYKEKKKEDLVALCFTKSTKKINAHKFSLSRETMLDLILKNNPKPIFIYDKENLRFLEVNEAALNLYGYSEDEFLQMDLTDLYTPEDIQTLLETSEQSAKEGELSKPFRHRKKDGGYVFVRLSKFNYEFDGIDSYLNIIDDVTDRLELEKYNQLFKSAFDHTNDMIFITDPTGLITYTNDSTSRNLGIPKLELINTSITSHCNDEDRIFINSSVFQSHIKETATFTIKLKTSEGNAIETEMTSTPIFNINNDVESFSLIAKVSSAQKPFLPATKEIIKEVVKEVVVEKPLSGKAQDPELGTSFLSGVFHEILTPMNVILGFSQELTESIQNMSPEQKEAVDIINQNRSSLLGLMNSIIEFSDLQSKKTENVISSVTIVDIVEPLDKNIKDITGVKDIEFAYGKISSSLKFSTDRKKFESFLNNLIRLVSKITSQKKIYFSAYPFDDDSFNISVSDGFARSSSLLLETLKKLFIEKKDPKESGISKLNFQIISLLLEILEGQFVTINEHTDKHDFAFNFPLELAKNFEIPSVEEIKEPEVTIDKIEMTEPEPFSLKDEIEIEELDSGHAKTELIEETPITEIINVEEKPEVKQEAEPITEEEISIDETPEPVSRKNGISSLRCLYIEDQIDSQILFKVQMKELKNIQFAASFEEALPLLESQKFDFIVMDINLQGEYNGLDALKIIQQMSGFQNIPVIAVTAYVLPGDKEKFIATGFTDFISKPIFREKMLESLNKIFVN